VVLHISSLPRAGRLYGTQQALSLWSKTQTVNGPVVRQRLIGSHCNERQGRPVGAFSLAQCAVPRLQQRQPYGWLESEATIGSRFSTNNGRLAAKFGGKREEYNSPQSDMMLLLCSWMNFFVTASSIIRLT